MANPLETVRHEACDCRGQLMWLHPDMANEVGTDRDWFKEFTIAGIEVNDTGTR